MVNAAQPKHETVDTRPLGVLVRAKNGSYVSTFPYDVDSEPLGHPVPEARHCEFSPTGDHLVSIEGDDGIAYIRSATDGSQVSACGGLNDAECPLKINFAKFSPRGSYLLTWARPAAGVSVPNLVVYRVSDGARLAAFHQKIFHNGFWPSIQWSDDEAIAARAVTNTIHFFSGDGLGAQPIAKLHIPGVSKFALSHGPAPYSIAAFIPGVKGAPGRISMYKHPDEGGEQLSSRTTFRADTVTFKWSPKGNAVLAMVSTNVDTTGKSYYGESEVYFMDNLGLADRRVELPKEGPTYDAAWSPTGMEFIIIYGYMPASATMFNEKGEFVFDFGTGSRNTISFSPHGRFVALGGFGNLAGHVEFWDKNRTTLVGRAELPCTTSFTWSPCSRYFLGATTFPRLRVDNGLKVVRFDGKTVMEHKMNDTALYQAEFRPALRGTYADPKNTMNEMLGGPPEDPKTATVSVTQKKGVYRPPGSRGLATTMRVHDHVAAGSVDKATFMKGSGSSTAAARPGSGKKFVPGMDPALLDDGPSKASLARKRKKERMAKAKEEEASTTNGNAAADGPVSPEEIVTAEEAEKRAKKLKKKLRMIDTLKNSQKEGKELNAEQVAKVESASTVEAELKLVEKRLEALKA